MIRAHHVIDDLEKLKFFYEDEGLDSIRIDALIKLIKSSQKFKFGTYNKMIDMFSKKSLKETVIFQGEKAKRYKFPYALCWFEYDGWETDQHCVLVLYSHEKREFTAWFFFKSPKTKSYWVLQPLGVNMGIGQNLEGQDSNICIINTWNSKGRSINDYADDEIDHAVRCPCQFLEMALRLFCCKNIGTVYVEPPEKLQKKRAKKGKKPLFRYHTLILKPVGKRQKSLAAQGLWSQAVSTTMGHDRHYPPPGLFGKYPGTFWIQPYTRGKKKEGIVHKDYDVTRMV